MKSTGIKIANRGEWLNSSRKWHISRKDYLKIRIKVYIGKKKNPVFLEVTSEVREKNVKEISRYASENNNLKGILEDGMYDSNNNFKMPI
jgi:valyl-tRNA synthetase